MSNAWDWLKRFGVWIAGALLLVIGAGWLWRRQRDELGKVKDRLAVAEATKEIARLRGQREEIAKRVGETDEVIDKIDAKIATHRQAVLDAYEVDPTLTDEEVAERLRRVLGG